MLAEDPSNADAYEMWQVTEHEIWMKLLTLEGEYGLVAKRLMDLASSGRAEISNDVEAIRALVKQLYTDDVPTRIRATRELSAAHGEYAVAVMVHALADQGDADKRVITMQALTQMGSDVVLPLLASLESEDAYLRRNVALTLGYIGDPRANAALAGLASSDPEQSVRTAATEALSRCGGSNDAVAQFLALGDAYYAEDDSVLMPHQGVRRGLDLGRQQPGLHRHPALPLRAGDRPPRVLLRADAGPELDPRPGRPGALRPGPEGTHRPVGRPRAGRR